MKDVVLDGVKRDRLVTVRLTLEEHAELVQHAKLAGISMSQLVRFRVLGLDEPKARVPALNITAWHDFGRALGNLNQLVHHLNQQAKVGHAVVQMVQVKVLISELVGLVKGVRRLLIGA